MPWSVTLALRDRLQARPCPSASSHTPRTEGFRREPGYLTAGWSWAKGTVGRACRYHRCRGSVRGKERVNGEGKATDRT